MAAASRNMSACSWQAVSQVGCRLMVASSAKISRPRWPGSVGREPLDLGEERVDLGRATRAPARVAAAGRARRGGRSPCAALRGRRRAYKVANGPARRNGKPALNAGHGPQSPMMSWTSSGLSWRGEPLGAGAPPGAAALVERQLQGAIRLSTSCRGGHVRQARPGAERRLVEVVERGEAARKELAVDHALGEAVDRSGSRAATPARAGPRRPAACCASPASTGGCAPRSSRWVPSITRRWRRASRTISAIVALAGHREGRGIDRAEHVEIDEAVVERRDQRVGHRMGEPHQVAVGARRVDDDEIVACSTAAIACANAANSVASLSSSLSLAPRSMQKCTGTSRSMRHAWPRRGGSRCSG